MQPGIGSSLGLAGARRIERQPPPESMYGLISRISRLPVQRFISVVERSQGRWGVLLGQLTNREWCFFIIVFEACGSHMRHVGVLPLRTDGRFLFSENVFFGLHFKILCKVANLKRCLQLFEKTKRQFLETTVHLNDTQSASTPPYTSIES